MIAYNRLHVQVVVVYVLVRGPEYVRLLVLLVPTLINFNIFQKGLIVIYLQYVQACLGSNGSSTGTYYQNNRTYVTYEYRRQPTGVSSLPRVRPREYWYLFRSKNVLNLPRSLSKLSLLEHNILIDYTYTQVSIVLQVLIVLFVLRFGCQLIIFNF